MLSTFLKIINNPSQIDLSLDVFKSVKNEIQLKDLKNYENNCKLKSLNDILINLGFSKRVEQDNQDKLLISNSLTDSKKSNNLNLRLNKNSSFQNQSNINNNNCCSSKQKNPLNHKVLIFSQLNSNLEVIHCFLLDYFFNNDQAKIYSSKLNEKDKFDLVEDFNSNPEFCIMLLNTNSGGLGLNLTAANIVIMYDHSWNPMKDLQAMDRAHRLGQKKTVEVLRLVACDSVEEQMMSLQLFKQYIANAIVKSTDTSDTNININSFMESFETKNTGLNDTKDNKKEDDITKGKKYLKTKMGINADYGEDDENIEDELKFLRDMLEE